MPKERFARGEQPHPARRALEERRAELVLERADLTAERRLRHVHASSGAPDVSLFGDGDEILNLREAHERKDDTETAEERGGGSLGVSGAGIRKYEPVLREVWLRIFLWRSPFGRGTLTSPRAAGPRSNRYWTPAARRRTFAR